jgi:two-component system, cell cycle response regulator
MSTPASKAFPESPAPAETSSVRPQIIVADDCDDTRDVIKLMLQNEYEVLTCGNGQSAWEQLEQSEDVKALVTDFSMPELDGVALTERIRKSDNPRIKDLPVIVVTGATDKEVRRRAFVNGATGFILKPVDAIQLKALLNAYVRLGDVQRELKQKSAALEEQSVSDALTGLHSRRYFMDRGEQDVAFSLRREKNLAVVRIDIDRFAEIWSSHNKERVDALMKWLGKLLLANARVEDTVARVGDAEFAILAIDTNAEAAMAVCHRLRDAVVKNPFTDGNITVPISFRFGAADLAKDRLQTMDALLVLAQERLVNPQSQVDSQPAESPTTNDVVAESDVAPPSEEVTEAPKPAVADPIEALSVEELEQLIRQEVTSATSGGSTRGKTDVPPELVSIEAALRLLAQGKGDALDPYLEPLMKRVQPLLDYHQGQNKKK